MAASLYVLFSIENNPQFREVQRNTKPSRNSCFLLFLSKDVVMLLSKTKKESKEQ